MLLQDKNTQHTALASVFYIHIPVQIILDVEKMFFVHLPLQENSFNIQHPQQCPSL